jgi:hypothetical protein
VLWAAGALLAAGTVTVAGGTNGRTTDIRDVGNGVGDSFMGGGAVACELSCETMPGLQPTATATAADTGNASTGAASEGIDAPQAEPEPAPVPAPAEAVEPAEAPAVATPAPEVEPDGGPEQIICAVWGDLCAKALRVAECESGPDYYAGWSAHVGTFQIYPGHAGRFAAHGWDYWTDGDDIYANSVIAYEIFQESGWGPWPYCGLM